MELSLTEIDWAEQVFQILGIFFYRLIHVFEIPSRHNDGDVNSVVEHKTLEFKK